MSVLVRQCRFHSAKIVRGEHTFASRPSYFAARKKAESERRDVLDRMLRVDHAGELGADRIYAGQYAVLGNTSIGPTLLHMWEQEKVHRKTFEELLPKYRARPTVLMPLWNIAGYVLGAGTALMGREAAMACTVAVETEIGNHYNNQIRELIADTEADHSELLQIISRFRDEELEHHDIAVENDAQKAPFYQALTLVIRGGCRVAIFLSERI